MQESTRQLGTIRGYLRQLEMLAGRTFLIAGGTTLLFLQSLADIRFGATDRRRILKQFQSIGVNSLPLAAGIGLFTGMIFALNFGIPLRNYGTETEIGGILGLAIVRTLAPVFTAFILAARIGSAMTAELGTMAVSDEIDSLRVMGIKPTRYLAMPRILASIIVNPLLTAYSAAMGIAGGLILSQTYLGVPPEIFWERLYRFMDMKEITTGLTKSIVFGAMYSSICVYYGLTTRGGAEGVGRSTTNAVVVSLTMILVADFIITRFLFG